MDNAGVSLPTVIAAELVAQEQQLHVAVPVPFSNTDTTSNTPSERGCDSCLRFLSPIISFVLLGVGFGLMSIPPLLLDTQRSRVIYVACMFPVLTVVATCMQYFLIEAPVSELNRLLRRTASEMSRMARDFEQYRPSSDLSTLWAGTHLPDSQQQAEWLDAKFKEMAKLQDNAARIDVYQKQKVLYYFMESMFRLCRAWSEQCLKLKRATRTPTSSFGLCPVSKRDGMSDTFLPQPTDTVRNRHRTLASGSVLPQPSSLVQFTPLVMDSVTSINSRPPPAVVFTGVSAEGERGEHGPVAVTAGPNVEDVDTSDSIPVDNERNCQLLPGNTTVTERASCHTAKAGDLQMPTTPVRPLSTATTPTASTFRSETITLRRGNRFPTDSENVFFYVEISLTGTACSSSLSPTICAYEALVSGSSSAEGQLQSSFRLNDTDGVGPRPYTSFLVGQGEGGRREKLQGPPATRLLFEHCEVEVDQPSESMNLSSLAVPVNKDEESDSTLTEGRFPPSRHHGHTDPNQATTAETSPPPPPPPLTESNSYIVSFAPISDRPMRLTFLAVHLVSPGAASPPPVVSIPVLECVLDGVLCVLLSADVTMDASSGDVSTITLNGISVEDFPKSSSGASTTSSRLSRTPVANAPLPFRPSPHSRERRCGTIGERLQEVISFNSSPPPFMNYEEGGVLAE